MICKLLDGESVSEVASDLKVRPNTILDWRNRFAIKGVAGLHDRPRSDKPPKYDEEFCAQVLKTLEQPPPRGQSCWDGPAVARHLGASDDAVWRVLRKQNICLARQRSWCVNTDPEFAPKAADIVGLYLAPPEKALVISVDEKSSIEALERAIGYPCQYFWPAGTEKIYLKNRLSKKELKACCKNRFPNNSYSKKCEKHLIQSHKDIQ